MDQINKQWESDPNNVKNLYRNSISVNILGMIDDLAGISTEGPNTTKLDAFINTKSGEKNLQFGISKCSSMVIGKPNVNKIKNVVKVEVWKQ